jgi:hypothetical protein
LTFNGDGLGVNPSEVAELEEFNVLMDLLYNFRHGTGENGWNLLLSNSNLFSVKSVRFAIDKCVIVSTSRPTRWSSLIPSKFLIFVWRAERNRIPTRVELDLKGIDIPSILCPIFETEFEIVDHILAKCDWVSYFWNFFLWWGFEFKTGSSVLEIIDFIKNLSLEKKKFFQAHRLSCFESVIFSSFWLIWNARNEKIFSAKKFLVEDIFVKLQHLYFCWLNSKCKKSCLDWTLWFSRPMDACYISCS